MLVVFWIRNLVETYNSGRKFIAGTRFFFTFLPLENIVLFGFDAAGEDTVIVLRRVTSVFDRKAY